jgi:hypothetical protein
MANATIRLGCMMCDRNDFDGITPEQLEEAIQTGWKDVSRVQTYRESRRMYDTDDTPPGCSVFDWETHLGWCPDCAAD